MVASDQPTESIYKRIARLLGGSGFLLFCRVFGAAITFLTQVLLARSMGPTELGTYVLAFSWLTLLSVVPAGGYNAAALRFVGQGLADKDHAYTRGYIRHTFKIILTASTSIVLLAIAGAFLFPEIAPAMDTLYLTAVLAIPFFAVLRASNGIAMAAARFAQGYLPNNVLRPSLFLALIWLLLVNDVSLDAGLAMLLQFVAVVSMAVLTTVLMRQFMRELASPDPPVKETRVWNRSAIPLLGVELFTSYFQPITVIVSGFFLPKADIGIYNVGYRVALVISFTLVAIDAFTGPVLSRHYRTGERARLIHEIQYSTLFRFGISFAAVVFLVFFGEWVLRLFGDEFVEGHKIMIVLALAQLSHAAVGPVTRLLAISGHHKRSLVASGTSLVLWLALTAFLLPAYGILGVAIAVFIALTTWALVLRHFVVRYLRIGIFVFVRDLEPAAEVVRKTP
jgi:O-antigen/teichoic acid export membrane protein